MDEPESIQQALAARLAKVAPLGAAELEALIETPPTPDMGDLALPCFTLAKQLRRSPAQIAQELARSVELPAGVREARAAGPYLNFFIDRPAYVERVLRLIRRLGAAYGQGRLGAGKTVLIEFSSPNIAKHLGVHHLPSAAIGMALYRIYHELGYKCVRINALGDWGTGFGRLIAAVAGKVNPVADELALGESVERTGTAGRSEREHSWCARHVCRSASVLNRVADIKTITIPINVLEDDFYAVVILHIPSQAYRCAGEQHL